MENMHFGGQVEPSLYPLWILYIVGSCFKVIFLTLELKNSTPFLPRMSSAIVYFKASYKSGQERLG